MLQIQLIVDKNQNKSSKLFAEIQIQMLVSDIVSYSCYDKLYHKLCGFKTIQICPQNFRCWLDQFWAKVKIQAGLAPSGSSGRESVSLLFLHWHQPPVWPVAPSSILKASFHHHISLSSLQSNLLLSLRGHLMITFRTPK